MQKDKYKQIPLTGLALLGSAFSKLPESARTMVATVQKTVGLNETLFIGVNEKGIKGILEMNSNGTVGNIMQINEQGKHIIAGRMRFKPVDSSQVSETVTAVTQIDPMMMAIAAALYSINNKLDDLQKKADNILKFLTRDKQSRQRGNLNMLSDIMEEYKRNCNDEKVCCLRFGEVQSIKREAYQNIVFYQDQISDRLNDQKKLHLTQKAHEYLDNILDEFREYQLACYLFGYASLTEVMLQKNFGEPNISSVADKMREYADRYDMLYKECRIQIAEYRRSSVEAKLIDGLGSVAKAAGEKLASVPIISKGGVDEALINVSESLASYNRNSVADMMSKFDLMDDCRLRPFEEDLYMLNIIHNRTDGLLTDGENLYIRVVE